MPSGFDVKKVEDARELKKVQRLRYKVYCDEWGFERHEDNPGGIENDIYDKSAAHFSAKNSEGDVVGTIRLILDSPEGFPIEQHCDIQIEKYKLKREGLAEISRLAIRKDYRRRAEDRFFLRS